METKKEPWRKKFYQKVNLETKLLVVDQILSGQISQNKAATKYQVPRTTITYWIRIYSTLYQQKEGMTKDQEIKKLKKRIEALKFMKEFQQDIIADMELITGVDLSKKSLPKTLANEIELKKKKRSKLNGSINVLGSLNKPTINASNSKIKNK